MRAGVVAVLMGAGIAVVTGSSGPGVDAAEPPMTPGQIILASVTAGGVHADVEVESASLSADGTIVAFETAASFGAAGNGFTQVWVKDLVTGTLDVVSVDENGAWGNGDSGDPDLSADGKYVVFESAATNLADGTDTNGVADVLIKDLESGAITLVSKNSAETDTGNGESENAVVAVSDDGLVVAFESVATDLVPEITFPEPVPTQTYVRNLSSGETLLLSTDDGTNAGSNESKDPRISGDGSTVVFETTAPEWSGEQVLAADLDAGELTLVATDSNDVPGSGRNPDVTADGSLVVFQSNATNFPPFDTSSRIHLKNLDSGQLTPLTGDAGDAQSPDVSDDGSVLAFESRTSNLVPGDTDGLDDVFVRDLSTGTTTLVSEQDTAPVDGFDLSGDGTVVAFRSAASYGQDASDGGVDDIFVKVVSQGVGTVSGLVTDGFSGAPIEGACITLTDGSDDHGPACTDANGRYELPGVPRPASYTALVDPPVGGTYLDRDLAVAVVRGTEHVDLTLDADRDGNGEADESQDNTAVIPSPTPGEYVTLAWPAGVSVVDVEAVDPPEPPAGYVLPHGLVSFTATGLGSGQAVTFTLYVSSTAGVTGYAKYHDGAWSILSAELVAIFDDRVEITLTDGGPGDDDGAANGTIVDPGGVVAADGAQLIQHVLDELDAMPLPNGTTNPLAASLQVSLAAFERGQMNAACNTLNAFANKVAAQAGKKLTADQANALVEGAADASAAMGCA